MSVPSTPSHSHRHQSKSKTLPALPSGEQNVEFQVSLSRSYSVGAVGIADTQDTSGDVDEPEGPDLSKQDVADSPSDQMGTSSLAALHPPPMHQSTHNQPRHRSSSTQNSNRDFFVYAEHSSPTVHLRHTHHRSKTLPTTVDEDAPGLPGPRARPHSTGISTGIGSSYTRVRVDDNKFWNIADAEDDQGESQQHHLETTTQLTDDDARNTNLKDPDALPSIPGSSASSIPPPVPEKVQDLTDTLSSPNISQPTISQPTISQPPISQPTRLQPKDSTRRSSADRPRRHDTVRVGTNNEPPKRHPESYPTPGQGPIKTGEERSKPHHPSPTDTSTQPSNPLSGWFFGRLTQAAERAPPEPPKKATNNTANESVRPSHHDSPLPPKPDRDHRVSFAKDSDRIPVSKPHAGVTDKDSSSPSMKPSPVEPKDEADGKDEEEPANVTKYMRMLLAVDKIPRIHNLAASFFTWILLAGFVLFPGTFTSLRNSGISNGSNGVTEKVAKGVLTAVSHVSLFVIAFLCSAIGAGGMSYLWWRWMKNYIWPGLMNSLAGVVSTLSSVYGAQHGEFSLTSIITLSVTGSAMVICGALTGYYMLWKIRKVKSEHDRIVGKQRTGKHGEGFIERIKRKANESSGPTGSIVV